MTDFNIHDWRSDQILKKINEHHDDDFPGGGMSAFELLDKLKKGNKELYDQVEAFMSKMDENMTSTAVSAETGNSEAFATPQAFSKKGKWKNKNYKYQQ